MANVRRRATPARASRGDPRRDRRAAMPGMANGVKLELPEGLASRSPTRSDIDAAVSVIAASEEATQGVVDVIAEDVRSDWERPSFDLSSDAVVVTDAGRIVAYAEVFFGRAWVHVHPHHRGRGIGAAGLGWTEARGRGPPPRKGGPTGPDAKP